MKIRNLRHRIGQVEKRLSFHQPSISVVVRCVTQQFALDLDQCVEIVNESRPVRTAISVVNLLDVPPELNANQLERHLREHAEEICSAGGDLR